MRNAISLERRQIGLDLHEAERSLGLGREALRAARLDGASLEEINQCQAQVVEARLARNGLRAQLAQVKIVELPLPRIGWAGGY